MENKELERLLEESKDEALSEDLLDGENPLVNKVEKVEGEKMDDAEVGKTDEEAETTEDKEDNSEDEEKDSKVEEDKKEDKKPEEDTKSEDVEGSEVKDEDKKEDEDDDLKNIKENMESIFDILKSLNEELVKNPTITKNPEEIKADLDNKDIYNDETEPVDTEDVEGIVVKESEKPTVEKDPSEDSTELDNEDIYNKETEPVKAEDVEGIVVEEYTDFELMQWLDENGYEPTLENVEILREEMCKPTVEKDPEIKEVKLDNEDFYNKETEPVKSEDVEGIVVKESEKPTVDKEPEVKEVKLDNEDFYNAETEEKAEDVEGIVVKEEFSDYELMQWLDENGYEPSFENVDILREGYLTEKNHVGYVSSEAKEETKLDKLEKEIDKESTNIRMRKGNYVEKNDDGKIDASSTNRAIESGRDNAIVKANNINKENKYRLLNRIIDGVQAGLTINKTNRAGLKNHIAEKKHNERQAGAIARQIVGNHNDKVENTKGVLKKKGLEGNKDGKVKYDRPYNIGKLKFGRKQYLPNLGEATDFELMQWLNENGYEPTFENIDILREELDNADIYNKETEPVKAEDVEGVDQAPQKDKLPIEKSNEDKEYDVDEEYAAEKTAKVEPKDILKESVTYGSLKEALALGVEYFTEDTYILDTAEAKQAKLIEQVALSLGKESMDPLYDELLKSAVYTQRLQEALVNKYANVAKNRVNSMVDLDESFKSGVLLMAIGAFSEKQLDKVLAKLKESAKGTPELEAKIAEADLSTKEKKCEFIKELVKRIDTRQYDAKISRELEKHKKAELTEEVLATLAFTSGAHAVMTFVLGLIMSAVISKIVKSFNKKY